MSQVFFKSNADGAQMVQLPGEVIRIDFSGAMESVNQIAEGFREFSGAAVELSIELESFGRAYSAIIGKLDRYDRLRRQHKAKARGKNWRAVK